MRIFTKNPFLEEERGWKLIQMKRPKEAERTSVSTVGGDAKNDTKLTIKRKVNRMENEIVRIFSLRRNFLFRKAIPPKNNAITPRKKYIINTSYAKAAFCLCTESTQHPPVRESTLL